MDGITKSTATVILVLIAVACGNSTTPVSTSGTTATIAGDSQWQIPAGFRVVPTPTGSQGEAISSNDVGPPPDIPDFSMTRESEIAGVRERVLIVVWADGVSAEADPREALMSWTEDGIRLAEYESIVVTDRDDIQSAAWRGQAQSYDRSGRELPQGMIAAVVSHSETQRTWRLSCFVSSAKVSDEVARICDQFQADFRPL